MTKTTLMPRLSPFIVDDFLNRIMIAKWLQIGPAVLRFVIDHQMNAGWRSILPKFLSMRIQRHLSLQILVRISLLTNINNIYGSQWLN